MANITELYPIRYAQDISESVVSGLIRNSVNNMLDLTLADRVTGLTITTVPADITAFNQKSTARFIFKTNDSENWYRLTSSGAADYDIEQDFTVESVLEEGNTIEELRALTSIPAFVNKRLRYAIALNASDIANQNPQIKFQVECVAETQQLVKEIQSPEYSFDNKIIITNIETDMYTEAGGQITLTGRYNRDSEDDSGGGYSDWISLSEMVGVVTDKIQYKAEMRVADNTEGTLAVLRSIKTEYNDGGVIAASTGICTIITKTEDWRVDLKQCRIVIRHSQVSPEYVRAYVTFRTKTYKVTGEALGTGTGQRSNYELTHKDGIKLDTVMLYSNGAVIASGYDVNCETGQIIVNQPLGSVLTCDYEYGYGAEDWIALELSSSEEYEGYTQSVYRVSVSDSESDTVRSIAAIKVELLTVTGEATDELIGYGTGSEAVYKLRYPVRSGILTVKANGTELPETSYAIQSDTQYVKVNAGYGVELRCDYEWESEGVKVYQVNGIFSE